MSSRRDFIKNCGLLAAGTTLGGFSLDAIAAPAGKENLAAAAPDYEPITGVKYPIRELKAQTDKQITYVVVGAGNRGTVYSRYAKMFPSKAKLVGVSDINEFRLKKMSDAHGVPAENRFGDYHEILAAPKLADAMVISLPDYLHYDACMLALAKGYHVLLEKPAAQTEKECRDILAQSRKYNRIVAVCHVLRYAPYFIALREVVRSGMIGDVVSIQHLEPIEATHMAHSYVRGNWHSSKATTPIILAKSCHDLDIIRWIVDKPCRRVSAEGSLYYFKKENAPEGAPMRCTDGCPHSETCPFNAVRLYGKLKRRRNVLDLDSSATMEEVIAKLKTTDYGRCVFHCDNDQPDHYVTTLEFEGGATASFAMEAFVPWGGRRTRIMGTKGYIEGDMKEFIVTDFMGNKGKRWYMNVDEIPEYKGAGHGGGDLALFRDFVEAVAFEDAGRLTSNIEASIESHIMGFMCEKSRLSSKKVAVKI